jgi:hypothetical protein
MRAGMSLTVAGTSALGTSAVMLTTVDARSYDVVGAIAGFGVALVSAGSSLWFVGAPGRREAVDDPALMYAGLSIAMVGLAALAPSSGLLAVGLRDADGGDLVAAALGTGGAANALIAIGSPLWAKGAAAALSVPF